MAYLHFTGVFLKLYKTWFWKKAYYTLCDGELWRPSVPLAGFLPWIFWERYSYAFIIYTSQFFPLAVIPTFNITWSTGDVFTNGDIFYIMIYFTIWWRSNLQYDGDIVHNGDLFYNMLRFILQYDGDIFYNMLGIYFTMEIYFTIWWRFISQ